MSRFPATLLGLLAVAALTALAAWEAAPRIEADLRSRAAAALSDLGVPAAVRIDGRDVTVGGGLDIEGRDRALGALERLRGVRAVGDVRDGRGGHVSSSPVLPSPVPERRDLEAAPPGRVAFASRTAAPTSSPTALADVLDGAAAVALR